MRRLRQYQIKNPDEKTELVRVKEQVSKKKDKVYKNGFLVDKDDPYPWLMEDDERRFKSDEELIQEFINLDDSKLSEDEKVVVRALCLKYRDAFSLRDELGENNDFMVEIKLKDNEPFYIKPYPIKETDKALVDKEMRKGCLLGILKKDMTPYSSPIMLITRKQGGIKRIVTDFRELNARVKLVQCSLPLMKDAIQILGKTDADIASTIDLRDAFHTLKVKETDQKYLGITPYFGSSSYVYQRLPMGLNVSPAIFAFFINGVLREMEHPENYVGIVDDIFMASERNVHMNRIEDLFKAIIENGLRISPKKCHLFKEEVVYMGVVVSYKTGRPTMTPTKSKIDAITHINKLASVQDVRAFCGMVNFLSIFLPMVQKCLIPLYNLMKKNVDFVWTDAHQEAFDKIKDLITNSPILTMPNTTGEFTLESDTSKVATGCALFQLQKEKQNLVAFHSKRLLDSASRYGISELEMHGLYINIKAFEHYLRGVRFNVIVDHSALVYIMKAKKEPPTLRLKKLIEKLSDYSFTIRFESGKNMFISDFLSRHPMDTEHDATSDVQQIHLTYDNNELLHLVNNMLKQSRKCHVLTRSQAKEQGITVPELFETKQETTQPIATQPTGPEPDPIVALPEAPPEVHHDPAPRVPGYTPVSAPVFARPAPPVMRPQNNEFLDKKVDYQNVDEAIVLYPSDLNKGKRLIEITLNRNPVRGQHANEYRQLESTDILYRDKSPLFNKDGKRSELRDEDIMYKKYPHQNWIRKQLSKIKHKVLENSDLPFEMNEIIQEQKKDPFFKRIYEYIAYSRLPSGKNMSSAQEQIRIRSQEYVLIQKVLFHVVKTKDNEAMMQLAIPQVYVPRLLYSYHTQMMAGHQGMTRTWLTMSKKYWFPYMLDNIRRYIQACRVCQIAGKDPDTPSSHHIRVPMNFRPFSRLSIDIKFMPNSRKGFKYILLMCCEYSNYLEAAPLMTQKSEEVVEKLQQKIFFVWGPPEEIISDQGPNFTSELTTAVYDATGVHLTLVSPDNHGSLRVERYIKTVGEMMKKYMVAQGSVQNWPHFLQACMYAYNTFTNPHWDLSPYEICRGFPPKPLSNINFDPSMFGDRTTREYVEFMQDRFRVMKEVVSQQKLREQQAQFQAQRDKHTSAHVYAKGDLVWLFAPNNTDLQPTMRKFTASWIGPLVISQILDETHFLLCDVEGKLLKMLGGVNAKRIKPCMLEYGEMKDNRLLTYHNIRELNVAPHTIGATQQL